MSGSDFNKQYGYDEMSNKVIRSERRPRNDHENTLPTSLAGQISVKEMGSRVVSEKQSVQQSAKPNKKKSTSSSSQTFNNQSYSTSYESINYRPTNEESAHIFDLIMTQVRTYLPDTSHEVILSAADVILEILKVKDSSIVEKRREISDILGSPVSDIELNELVHLSNRITDFEVSNTEIEAESDNDQEVAVLFDNSDDEENDGDEESDQDELSDTQDGKIEQVEEDAAESEVVIKSLDSIPIESESESQVPLHKIDQFYLQREIKKYLDNEDPSSIQKMNNEVFSIISNYEISDRELENELMELFNYEHFDLTKSILQNRWRIVFKIKLLQAEDEEAKSKIYNDMDGLDLSILRAEISNTETTQNINSKKRKLSVEDVNNPEKKIKPTTSRQPKIVDLDALSFDQGSHLMTNSKIKLPQGSFQQSKKSYDIISVPAPSPAPQGDDERLVPISELPEWARQVFPSSETSSLNRIQSQVYPQAFNSDNNILLCAPTGAGKTNVAMLAVLRTIDNYRNKETGKIDLKKFKVIYIAPLKALVQEQMREFQRRLTANFGIVVNELTGDSSLTKQQIAETQVLVTTPEKWDVITRKGSDVSYTLLTRLIIIDEIHLLHDERGPVLESIISRSIRQVETTGEPIRLVGLSATLPNYRDVAKFLRVEFDKGLFYFDSSYRPCPLEQQFIGIKEKKAIKKLNAMNEACYEKLLECVENRHQLIIFVHSRKDTFKTAKWLKEKLIEQDKQNLVLKSDSGTVEILKLEAENMNDRSLKEIVPSGFGIHHAGLNKEERSVVEDLFAQGHLQVLVSTATLAWGVNLPAHTVIIKGTETYSPERGTWVQLSPQDILQMLGRAGRPRYDKSGEGVIITSQDEIQYYLAILNQQLPIESQLISKLPDTLNAEIVLGSVKTRDDAVSWLGYTYLYIRMLQSPAVYHVGPDYADDKSLFWKRTDLIHSALSILHNNKLVHYNPESGEIKSTELGKVSSHYYINYETINMYNTQLKPWQSEIDILKIFASSGEFKFVPVRQEEKMEVTKLLEKCPFPVKENPHDPLAKVNVLLQTYISKLKLEGFALMADMIYVTQSAGRLLRAIFEITLKKGWASLSKIALNLCKMVEKRMWLTSSPFRQFGPSVPKEIIKATESSHLPWISYFNLSAAELAEALNFKGTSQRAYELLQQFPKLSLSYYSQPITPSLLRVQVEVIPQWTWNTAIHGNSELFIVLIEDCDGEKILFSDNLTIFKSHIGKDHLVEFTVPILEPLQPNYFITLISEKWLHSEWRIPLKLSKLKLPKKFPAYSELLDVQNVPTSVLNHSEFMESFDFTYFNKFQSQVFPILYNTNDNVFIGLAKGGGKTVCAELAFLNHWKQNKGRIVYINASQQKVDKLTRIWKKNYTKLLPSGKIVNKLTGDVAVDTGLLNSSHLILATPDQFYILSKRWRQRKAVQAIDLVVADDIQMIGNGTIGPNYEVIIARMRFISAQLETGLRIVALSSPLANGRDLGEWIGCSKQNIFNFDPTNRFNKIKEIRLQSSSINNYNSFILSLTKLCYEFLRSNTGEGHSLVFVSTRKQTIEIASSFIQTSERDGWGLLKVDVEEIEPYLKRVQDIYLREFLASGVGCYYDGMNSADRIIVEKLFANSIISILVATKDTCSYAPSARNVVILGTQEYDGREHRYVDYTINDVLEMAGCCKDDLHNEAKALILTNPSKLPFYNKFLNEALPIESYLLQTIHDHFIDEISTRSFKSKQDCIDWITFTYFYRRLQHNPSFYDVQDTSHLGISEYLSELIETTLKDLEDSKLLETEEDDEEDESIVPLNGTMIASHYNVSYITMKNFANLDNKTKLKGILEAVTSASEFETLPIRNGEDDLLAKIYNKVPVKVASPDFESPHFKAFILLQAHFSRISLPVDLALDQKVVLQKVLNLVYSCIDTLSSEGYLNAVHSMDLSQMIVQGVWNRDSVLKQVPYFNDAILARCQKHNVETVYDIMSLEDDVRDEILQLDGDKLNRVAEFVNKYPNIDISYEMNLSEPITSNEPKSIIIKLERDEEMDDLDIVSQYYPFPKQEGWWVVIGDSSTKQLYAIKKTTISKETQEVKLDFTVPNAGHHQLSIWCMCDSYLDADKEITFEVDVEQGEESDEE